jgi:predicted transcriptional regulator
MNATLRARTILDALKLPVERAAEIRNVPAEKLVEVLGTRDPVLRNSAKVSCFIRSIPGMQCC